MLPPYGSLRPQPWKNILLWKSYNVCVQPEWILFFTLEENVNFVENDKPFIG